jgi:hypothetical protein
VRGLEVYSIDQVYQSLYRPDLVREKLAGDPKGKVREAAARLDLGKIMASGAAPRVTIVAPAARAKSDTDEIAVEAAVTDTGGGIGRVEWRVNGVTLGLEERGLKRIEATAFRRTLSLEPGKNRIEVVAYNAKDPIASEPARITVTWDGERSAVPPKLHVLAVGVNDYWDSRLKLTNAVPDARALGAALAKAGARLYGEGGVKVTTVADAEVTIANLDKVLAALAGALAEAILLTGTGPAPKGAPTARPTHVVAAAASAREAPRADAAVVAELTAGMPVLLIETSGGWALIERNGRRLGYVEEKALVRLLQ